MSFLHKTNARSKRGFSLLEVLIVLAILGVLTCIVYPSYMQHLVAMRRTNVAAVLLDLAGSIEQFYIRGNTYSGATLSNLGTNDSSYKNYYKINIKGTANSYSLSAVPLANQANADSLCGTLGLDQEGNKTISGNGDIASCWP